MKIHACLAGKWENLCDDPFCKLTLDEISPRELFENFKKENYSLPNFIFIRYKNVHYWINSSVIQFEV